MSTKNQNQITDATEGCAAAAWYAAIRAELWAAGHEPLYQVVADGPAFGLRYGNKENREMILWALVPIDSEQRTRFAAALLARLHAASLHDQA